MLDVWLSYMDAMSQREDDPEAALREYIAGKLRFSFDHPDDSRVYANEVIAGAPHFADEIRRRVIPALQADVKVFGRWADKGLCRPIDARHLMVVLWSATQAYADFARNRSAWCWAKPRLTRKPTWRWPRRNWWTWCCARCCCSRRRLASSPRRAPWARKRKA